MNTTTLSEYAGTVSMTRSARRMGVLSAYDPAPPARLSPEELSWQLKLVAHWEGGPAPEHASAVPVVLVLEKETIAEK